MCLKKIYQSVEKEYRHLIYILSLQYINGKGLIFFMGYLLGSEQKFLNDNAFLYEERMSSQYARFLDKTPTYVTYYKINSKESTADTGFQSVERILGKQSPIKFNQINDFPIYNIDQIVLDLNQEEQGLDSNFEGEGIILPNTVKPTPNDIFTINHLSNEYIFVVTEIKYDTIKSNNFYKISFSVKSINGDYTEDLERQTSDKFDCIVSNIGTDEKVLIRSDDVIQLKKLEGIYRNIAEFYKMIFFNKRFNAFLCKKEEIKIYDKFQSEFINKHRLFNEKGRFETLFLTNEDDDYKLQIQYHKSIYSAIEDKDKERIELNNKVRFRSFNHNRSIFQYYSDYTVKNTEFTDIGEDVTEYIRQSLIEKIKDPEYVEKPPEPEKPIEEEGEDSPLTDDETALLLKLLKKIPELNVLLQDEEKPTSEDSSLEGTEKIEETIPVEDTVEEQSATEIVEEPIPETSTNEESTEPIVPNPVEPEPSEEIPTTPTEEFKPAVESPLTNLIINYFNDKIETIYDIDRDGLSNYLDYMDENYETFILTPLTLFIIKHYFTVFMNNK